MVYRLILSYRGTAYAGWQRQPNAVTVQQRVEEALSELLGIEVEVVGAGRTDAGVHARGQAAHLVLSDEFPVGGLVHGTNHRLPDDIRILAAERMPEGFHARKSALAKEYRYRLVRARIVDPLDAPFVLGVDFSLDLDAMRRATGALVGEHDFSAFALAGGAHRSPVRRIHSAAWREEGRQLELRLVGDGFLRGMVRGLVGTLLEVGRGRRGVQDFTALLAGADRGAAGPTAAAHGLVLQRVEYAHAPVAGYRANADPVVT